MEFNKLVFAGLALGCLGAAAGGSYLATRHNQSVSAPPWQGSYGEAPPKPSLAAKEGRRYPQRRRR